MGNHQCNIPIVNLPELNTTQLIWHRWRWTTGHWTWRFPKGISYGHFQILFQSPRDVVYTFWKINMAPENGPLEEENGNHHSWGLCWFFHVFFWILHLWLLIHWGGPLISEQPVWANQSPLSLCDFLLTYWDVLSGNLRQYWKLPQLNEIHGLSERKNWWFSAAN